MSKIFLKNNRKKIIFSLFLISLCWVVVFLTKKNLKADEALVLKKKPLIVKTQTVSQSRSFFSQIKYPGIVVSDQEVNVIAQASGIVQSINFDLGDQISIGKLLLTIDDQALFAKKGENDLKSTQVRQLEKALEQAEENYDQAKRNYKENKTSVNKTAKDIAELQKESAKIALENALGSRLILAPISGKVVSRNVSVGDFVSLGQSLASLSTSKFNKIQFYVSKDELSAVVLDKQVQIGFNGKKMIAKIKNIAPQAENSTGRFLVEANLVSEEEIIFPGLTVDVWLEKEEKADKEEDFLLPLSAISKTQNESYIFVVKNGVAEKILVEIISLKGELAEVKAVLQEDYPIIIEGNKFLQSGDKVEIK